MTIQSLTPTEIAASDRVLFVDDDPHLLAAVSRVHGAMFAITTAAGGKAACELLDFAGPFAVLVADRQMPLVDGIRVLEHARKHSPQTVRILLTGQADVDSAQAAVNAGQVFRFLTKPCGPEQLREALFDALRHHHATMAEWRDMQQTINGSLRMLVDLLSLVSSRAFGRSLRIHRCVRHILSKMDLWNAWEYEAAALLSQVGVLALPRALMDKLEAHAPLNDIESRIVTDHHRMTYDVIASVPRLEPVARVLRTAIEMPTDGRSRGSSTSYIGARILTVAEEFERMLGRGLCRESALDNLRGRPELYDPAVVAVLESYVEGEPERTGEDVAIEDLDERMVLESDISGRSGEIIARRGLVVTPPLLMRLRSAVALGEIDQESRVLVGLFRSSNSGTGGRVV